MAKNNFRTIKAKCEGCGSTVFELAQPKPPKSAVTCEGCGKSLGTWGDLRA